MPQYAPPQPQSQPQDAVASDRENSSASSSSSHYSGSASDSSNPSASSPETSPQLPPAKSGRDAAPAARPGGHHTRSFVLRDSVRHAGGGGHRDRALTYPAPEDGDDEDDEDDDADFAKVAAPSWLQRLKQSVSTAPSRHEDDVTLELSGRHTAGSSRFGGPGGSLYKPLRKDFDGKGTPGRWAWVRSSAWWPCWWGFTFFLVVVVANYGAGFRDSLLPSTWERNPLDSWTTSVAVAVLCLVVIGFGVVPGFEDIVIEKGDKWSTLRGGALRWQLFLAVGVTTLIGLVSYVIGEQADLNRFGLANEFWAIVIGLIIANLLPFFVAEEPEFIALAAKMGEDMIKLGLILLGIDLQTMASLGAPGLVVSIPVTVVVLAVSYFIGRRMVKVAQRRLCMVLCGGLSVCGSSASTAIQSVIGATGEELTLSISIITIFTIIQMVAVPYILIAFGLNKGVIAAGLGGSINNTGSVVAAASFLGGVEFVEVAATVKIIQNAIMGFIAVGVALYWAKFEETPNSEWRNELKKQSMSVQRTSGATGGLDEPLIDSRRASSGTFADADDLLGASRPHTPAQLQPSLGGEATPTPMLPALTEAERHGMSRSAPNVTFKSMSGQHYDAEIDAFTRHGDRKSRQRVVVPVNRTALHKASVSVPGDADSSATVYVPLQGAAAGGNNLLVGADSQYTALGGKKSTSRHRAHSMTSAHTAATDFIAGKTDVKWYQMFWNKFPKFVVGFLTLSVCLTILRAVNDMPLDDDANMFVSIKNQMQDVSRWWFTLGFVGVGLASKFSALYGNLMAGVALDEMTRSQKFRHAMRLVNVYWIGQLFNIVLTMVVAYALFKDFDASTVV